MFFLQQIHFLRIILRRPHTDRIPEGVPKKFRRNRNRDSCEKSATGAENTGILRIPAGITNLGAAARSRHDELCRTAVPSTQDRTDDAATNPAGDAHDGTLICSQPATLLCPQSAPAAGVFLTGRGGQ